MPHFDHHIFVCINRRPDDDPKGCCAAKGSEAIRVFFKNELKRLGLKGKVRANAAGCLDQCHRGPTVVIYPEAVWYQVKTTEDAAEIVNRHILHGEIVERLLMKD
ncbi:MAG: (2Fe-2S) ferredoxin domain-containing protein [Acidobacteriia bacterium]|nr:(2Fe-2S) ferredoxin domain-containing protein [Terriglobia bacterium]